MTTITQSEWNIMKKILVNYWEKKVQILLGVVVFTVFGYIMKSWRVTLFSLIFYLIIRATDVFVEARWKR